MKWIAEAYQDLQTQSKLLTNNLSRFLNISPKKLTNIALQKFIATIILTKEYQQWDEFSFKRNQFKALIIEAGENAYDFRFEILEICQSMVQFERDFKTRYDTFELLFHFISNSQQLNDLSTLFIQICMTGMTWRVGKATETIRRAALMTLSHALMKNLLTPESLKDTNKKLFISLKGCVEDEWSLPLRQSTLELFKVYFAERKQHVSQEILFDSYPMILSRLDDSDDQIRIAAVDCFGQLITCKNFVFSNSTNEYIAEHLFLHLDDQNSDLRNRIFFLMKFMIQNQNQKFIQDLAKKNLELFKHKNHLIDLIAL